MYADMIRIINISTKISFPVERTLNGPLRREDVPGQVDELIH